MGLGPRPHSAWRVPKRLDIALLTRSKGWTGLHFLPVHPGSTEVCNSTVSYLAASQLYRLSSITAVSMVTPISCKCLWYRDN